MLEKPIRLLAMALLFTIECASAQVLAAGWTLNAGQAIWSPERRYHLIMQGDGNLVFSRASDGKVRWHTNTGGLAPNATKLTMQSDGNAVVQYTPPPIPRAKGEIVLGKLTPTPVYTVWRSDTAGNPGAYVAPLDDGNLVVYASSGKVLWSIGQDPETNKPNPQNLGDIVGRDLANVPILGVVGHVGFYDGKGVYQVMNENQVVQYVSIESFKATIRPEQYWGYGSPAIPQYYVTGCFDGNYCADDNTKTGLQTLQAREAMGLRAQQIRTVGAAYTLLTTVTRAKPRTSSSAALPGVYRCDTFVLDIYDVAYANITDATGTLLNISGFTLDHPLRRWLTFKSNLNAPRQGILPSTVFQAFKNYKG